MKKYIVGLSLLLVYLNSEVSFAGWSEAASDGMNGRYSSMYKELLPMAQHGDARAMYAIGLMYAKGQGVKVNYSQALDWFMKSAKGGFPQALYTIGMMCEKGQGINKKDYAQALDWYQKAAAQELPEAQYALGRMYQSGTGIKQNYIEAASWYTKAVENGSAIASYKLAYMYENGLGVKKDYVQAHMIYRLAYTRSSNKTKEEYNDYMRAFTAKLTSEQINESKERLPKWRQYMQMTTEDSSYELIPENDMAVPVEAVDAAGAN